MDLDELLGDIKPDTWLTKMRRPIYKLNPKELRRKVRWGIQRWRRGYSDCDVWNFDHYLARIIPPAMRQLRHELHGVPGDIAEQFDSMAAAAAAEWRRILDAVADGFEAWQTITKEYPDGERRADLERRWQEGARLLIEHFGGFWD